MEINHAAAKFWFDIVQTLGLVFLYLYTLWAEKNKVTGKRITDLDKKYDAKFDDFKKEHEVKCSDHHQRTAKIEVELKTAPTHKDMGEIHEKINDVHGSVKKLCGQLKGLDANVALIHEHLLSKGK